MIEEHRSPLSKVFTVSPIREGDNGVTLSFSQRDINTDPSLMRDSKYAHSATAGFRRAQTPYTGDEPPHSPMVTFMEQTIKHRQDRLREEHDLQMSD